jgi:hypothetical protein
VANAPSGAKSRIGHFTFLDFAKAKETESRKYTNLALSINSIPAGSMDETVTPKMP